MLSYVLSHDPMSDQTQRRLVKTCLIWPTAITFTNITTSANCTKFLFNFLIQIMFFVSLKLKKNMNLSPFSKIHFSLSGSVDNNYNVLFLQRTYMQRNQLSGFANVAALDCKWPEKAIEIFEKQQLLPISFFFQYEVN